MRNVSYIKLEATVSDMTFVTIDVTLELVTYRQMCSPFEEVCLQMKVQEVLNARTSARPKQ
jgi:hypothetical protein